MRTLILLLFLGTATTFSVVMPHVGVVVWGWITIMNPHRSTYGGEDLPVTMAAALATMVAWLIAREPRRLPTRPEALLILALMAWMTVSAWMSLAPAHSWHFWDFFFKSLMFVIFTSMIMTNRTRVHAMVWMMVMALGFYGVKGGVFTIVTGGNHTVEGPAFTVIADKNTLSVGMIMALPMMYYLFLHSSHRLVRQALLVAMGLTVVSVVGSYSRGGVLTLGVTLLYLWFRSRAKVFTALAGALVLVPLINFMPQQWFDRMDTVSSYERDGSVQGRFDAWLFAARAAMDRPLVGAGISATEVTPVFKMYAYDTGTAQDDRGRAAHSNVFQVLGDQGFVGLGIYAAIAVLGWVTALRIRRLTRDRPDLAWARDFASMSQVGMVAYHAGGLALSLAYFNAYYLMVVLLGTVLVLVRAEVAAPVARRAGVHRSNGGGGPATWPAPVANALNSPLSRR